MKKQGTAKVVRSLTATKAKASFSAVLAGTGYWGFEERVPVSDVWVLNASPVIRLGEIGRLDLLERLAATARIMPDIPGTNAPSAS